MINEQFIWRGNITSLPGGGTNGYPITNSTWPSERYGASLWSSKNLLWLFAGQDSTLSYTYNDLSTFSDGMHRVYILPFLMY